MKDDNYYKSKKRAITCIGRKGGCTFHTKDSRMKLGLGFSDELMRSSLMAAVELMEPLGCPSPKTDMILREN